MKAENGNFTINNKDIKDYTEYMNWRNRYQEEAVKENYLIAARDEYKLNVYTDGEEYADEQIQNAKEDWDAAKEEMQKLTKEGLDNNIIPFEMNDLDDGDGLISYLEDLANNEPDTKNSYKDLLHAYQTCHTITFEDNVTQIPKYYLEDAPEEKINMSKNTETIGRAALWDNANLKEATIPDKTKYVDPSTFIGCDSLQRIMVKSKDVIKYGLDDCDAKIIETGKASDKTNKIDVDDLDDDADGNPKTDIDL